LHLILKKKIGSVVVVDDNRHPVGIVTTQDLLKLLTTVKEEGKIEIINKNLSLKSRQILTGFFNNFVLWLKKFPNLTKAKLFVKEEKNGGLFKVVLSLIPKKGNPKVIKREGKNLKKVLKDVEKD
jgi:CBS domain-containing protein